MKCRKTEKRNLFSLFMSYTCEGCNKYKVDEEILIGNSMMFIYPLTNCALIEKSDYFPLFDRRLKILLLSFIMYRDSHILLWVDNLDNLENYETIYELFSSMKMDYIIILY